MSYSLDMDGLELFTAPFGNPQAVKPEAPAIRPQQPKAKAPQQSKAAAPQQASAAIPLPKSNIFLAQQLKTAAIPQPVKPKAPETHSQPANSPMGQPQQTRIPGNPIPDEKTPALQKEQAKATEPKPEQKPQAEAVKPKLEQKPQAEASAKAQPSVKTQPSAQAQPSAKEPPEKELSLDMSDHTVPAGKPLDATEDAKRKAHEEAEAKRKAEWEAKQAAKKQAREAALEAIQRMNDADIVSASTERVRKDVERLTRRNMKECVSDHIQDLCRKDPSFARKTMHPNKSMVHCFQYINRMAKDYIQQEMKDNDAKPENGIYGGNVPDGLVYQWSADYFNDPDAKEDGVKEEKFTPRPYTGTASNTKKSTKAKKAAKKEPGKKQEPKNGYEQMTLGV